jgi:hypothetical protein
MGHGDIQLRLSALELVCVSARQTEFPTRTELAAVKTFLTANAKGAPPHVRFSTLGCIPICFLSLVLSLALILFIYCKIMASH